MIPVYFYPHDCSDFDTIGTAGDIQPTECFFEEEKNGISKLSLKMVYDNLGKWRHVVPGGYLKAPVPVRVPPVIVSGNYATTVTRYEPVTSQVPIYESVKSKRPLVHYHKVEGKTVGKDEGAFIRVATKASGRRVTGYSSRTDMVAHEEISIVPASYGLDAAEDLATTVSDQLFRVVSVTQEISGITVEAEHVFYELAANYTNYKPDEESEGSGSTCVAGILSGAFEQDQRFSISSSSSKTVTGLDFERKSVVEALLAPEKGACALYGMVLLRDNYNIYCLPEEDVGYDRGYVVEYGKNMVSVQRTEDITDVVTRVYPYGKDADGNILYIQSGTKYAESEHAGDYPQIEDAAITTAKIDDASITTAKIQDASVTKAKIANTDVKTHRKQ